MTRAIHHNSLRSDQDSRPYSENEADEPVSMPQSFAVLTQALAAIGRANNSDAALHSLYLLLHDLGGLRALTLEMVQGAVTYFRPYGDVAALKPEPAGQDASDTRRVVVCPLECLHASSGQVTFVLPSDSPLADALLVSVVLPLSMLLDREALAQRNEEYNEKALHRINEVATIYEIGQAIDQIELKSLLQLITDKAALLMDAQACSLMLVHEDQETLRVAASHGLPDDAMEQEQRFGQGIAGRVAQTEQPMLIVEAVRDPRLEGMNLRPEIGSAMLVPMKSQENRVLGVLSIRRHHPAPDFTDDDLKLFSVFATQAALAVNNIRLYADLKRSAGELLKISTLTRALISTLDIDELLACVAEDVRNVVGMARSCVYMRDAHRAIYAPTVWRGYPDTIGRNPVREGEGAVGVAARTRKMIYFDARDPVSPDESRSRAYLQRKGYARSLGADAFVVVPILTREERCIGVIVADNKGQREPISRDQTYLLATYVNQAGIALENASLYVKTQEDKQKIQRLNDYTDNVLQSIGAGIISTDASGQIARWNRAVEETLKLPASQFRDASLTDVIVGMDLTDTEREHLLNMIQRVVETGIRATQYKLMLHPKDQEPMALNIIISRLMEHSHDRAGVVMICEDVTQEVRLEHELEKMRRLADIGQLAARMAHEVRNALSPMKGAAQIIRLDMETQSGSTEWPDIIIAEVDGLSRLTSEMLDFARPIPLDLRSLQIPEFLAGAVQALSTFLAEHRVDVVWNIQENIPDIEGDMVQLNQVIRNIVMNAAQAMTDGGTLAIGAFFDAAANQVGMTFEDCGGGIAPEELERIFRPFVTTKTKGTGLGLPIVQKIVDHHGGRVEVASTIGQGTCFTVRLPLTPPIELVDAPYGETPVISSRPAGAFPDN